MKRPILLVLFLALVTIVFSSIFYIKVVQEWQWYQKATATPIEEILKNPREYEETEVTVAGQVIESLSFGIKYFKVDDESGEIYVITQNVVPTKGEFVQVVGTFNQHFQIGTTQVATITEKVNTK